MATASKICAIAESQVGYHEGYLQDGRYHVGPPWENQQKYSLETPGLAWSDGYAWCCTFVSWCAHKAGASALLPCTASVAAARDWYKARGQFGPRPRVGDQVIYGQNGDAHTGLVIEVTDTTIVTIEGNTNDNGSAEGDGVYRKVRDRNDPWIYGYGHPRYAPEPKPATQPVVKRKAPSAKPKPAVSLAVITAAAKKRWSVHGLLLGKRIQVHRVLAALHAEGRTYRGWQLSLGYRGSDADGIPGHDSLSRLGERHGFRVIA